MSELKDRVALVTGASRNIGRSIALALAEGGASVIVNARSSHEEALSVVREIAAKGGRAAALLADVTEEGDVAAMVEEAIRRFGGIDILVNNAAIRHEAPLEEIDLARWRRTMAAILDSAFICIKACLPHLKASAAGTVINMGGLTSHTGAKMRPHVIAAKSGMIGLTRALAHDLAEHRITVNCVAPGLVETVRGGSSSGSAHHHAGRVFLLGRRTPQEEVAAMVRHLCGPHARFITGQVIHVNGGAFLGG